MTIKAVDLPRLIAAAVQKAVADKKITDESLAAISHLPVTVGLIETERVAESLLKEPETTLGYAMPSIDELKRPADLK